MTFVHRHRLAHASRFLSLFVKILFEYNLLGSEPVKLLLYLKIYSEFNLN